MTHLFDKLPPETVEEIKRGKRSTQNAIVETFMEGYSAAVYDFAIWKDGKQHVGCLQRDPKEVIAAKRAEVEEALHG